jgi:hypothetical protein
MTVDSSQGTTLREEIRAWITITELFRRTFELERHFATQWSVVNTLLLTPPTTVGEIVESVPASAQKKSSKHHDVYACIDDLRKTGFVKVKNTAGKDVSLKEGDLSVESIVAPQDRLVRAGKRYVRSYLEELFGAAFAEQHAPNWQTVVSSVLQFSMNIFGRTWADAITDVIRVSTTKNPQRLIPLIAGNTEYFIVLNSLWFAHLSGTDGDGFRVSTIRSFFWSTSSTKATLSVARAIDELIKNDILIVVSNDEGTGGPYYRLGDAQIKELELHANEYIGLRSQLRSRIGQTGSRA